MTGICIHSCILIFRLLIIQLPLFHEVVAFPDADSRTPASMPHCAPFDVGLSRFAGVHFFARLFYFLDSHRSPLFSN